MFKKVEDINMVGFIHCRGGWSQAVANPINKKIKATKN